MSARILGRNICCIRCRRPVVFSSQLQPLLGRFYATEEPQRWKVWTVPNIITFARMSLSPYLGYTVVNEQYELAILLTAAAGLSDLLDGYIAKRFPSQKSNLGAMIDPTADKVMIGCLTVALTYNGLLPWPLTALILLRDVCLVLGTFVMRFRALPRQDRMSRLLDFSDCNTRIVATQVSKYNTFLQLVVVGSAMAAPVFDFVNAWPLQCLWVATSITTLWSGAQYWQRRANLHPDLNKGKKR